MDAAEYIKMAEFEKTFWWHKGKLFLIQSILGNLNKTHQKPLKILEIGCGSGEIIEKLAKDHDVLGIDISQDALDFCVKRGLKNLLKGDINELDILKYQNSFDYVLALDVLEHIQDDFETMKRAYSMLKPGGYFIVNVPAHKFLWSEHDEALHHQRRYHSLEIKQKLTDAGFDIVKKSYFVATAFFPILLIRTWNTFFKKSAYPKSSYVILPKKLNDIATKVMKAEAKLLNIFNLPLGTTITVIAKKPDNA